MKAPFTSNHWKTFVFLTIVLFIFSCKPIDEPTPPPTPSSKPSITLNSVKNVTYTTATLSAMLTPNQDSTMVTFDYNSTLDPTWKTNVLSSKYSGSNTQEVSLNLTNLVPNTVYSYKVTAVNLAGSVTTSSLSFVTASYAKAIAKIYAASDVKISSAKLIATLTPNQASTSASFEYQSADGAWQSQALASVYSGADSVSLSLNLSGLEANTTYNYRLKALNIGGEVISEVATFTTYAVADYDGNLYHAVTIGKQTWLKENFRGTHYANGDPIANVTNADTWSTLTTGAYCWYNNDSEIGKVYGGLYNWYVGVDSRGLILGWHTPTAYEWSDLGKNYINLGYKGIGLAVMEAGNAHWVNTKYAANNSSGFTALPNGGISLDSFTQKYICMGLNVQATFWSSTDRGSSSDATIINNHDCGFGLSANCNKKFAIGLRLLKD